MAWVCKEPDAEISDGIFSTGLARKLGGLWLQSGTSMGLVGAGTLDESRFLRFITGEFVSMACVP